MKVRLRFANPSNPVIYVKGSELVPHPLNWRTHPTEQIDALKGILAEVGIADALKGYRLPDGRVQLIDGHARAEVLPDQEIPILLLDVNEEEAAKLLASFDPVGDMAGMDAAKLDELTSQLDIQSPALQKMLDELMAGETVKGVGEAELPQLADGDREPFQQMTFTLADSQAETVKAAITKAKQAGADIATDNENSNGNALALIASTYLEHC